MGAVEGVVCGSRLFIKYYISNLSVSCSVLPYIKVDYVYFVHKMKTDEYTREIIHANRNIVDWQ